jgi:SsrA-binding protein
MHKKEIAQFALKVKEGGLALVPLSLYFKDGRAKVELAVAKGKDVRDRRREISKREADRQIERALKQRSRT